MQPTWEWTGGLVAPVHFSERLLREIYFPGFKACFQEGGATSVMMAYNTLDGIPCATHDWLMNDMIKGEWGFNGFIISDGDALPIIYNAFGIYGTKKALSTAAINAGCDISISSASDGYYGEILKEAVEEGLVSEKRIDDAVRRVLRQKFRTGLFDNPFADPVFAEKITDCAEHRALALEAARQGIVLVKNNKNTLPLGKYVHSIALVGPMADWLLINHYGGFGRHEVTLLEGLKSQYPNIKVVSAKEPKFLIRHYRLFNLNTSRGESAVNITIRPTYPESPYMSKMMIKLSLTGKKVLRKVCPATISWSGGRKVAITG